jgi:hypothetical protein|tara:strand:- start:233 stop:577 length:345 start_codon:yes stop_codon:yes gene_type:complete
MLSGIIKSVGLGATIQTAELDDDSVTAPKIAGAPANTYTQTYSTADRTIANPTAAAPGDLVASSSGSGAVWGASSEANFDKIGTAVDALVADNLDLRKAVTALIDDLQTIGLVG